MPIVKMLVGLPASGKSTYAGKYARIGWRVISSDSIREELFGDASIQKEPNKVFARMLEHLEISMNNNENIIIDATNLTVKNRAFFLQTIANYSYTVVAIIFNTSLEECKKRNSERKRQVPIEVIEHMAGKIELPSKNEGFEIIDFYRNL